MVELSFQQDAEVNDMERLLQFNTGYTMGISERKSPFFSKGTNCIPKMKTANNKYNLKAEKSRRFIATQSIKNYQ